MPAPEICETGHWRRVRPPAPACPVRTLGVYGGICLRPITCFLCLNNSTRMCGQAPSATKGTDMPSIEIPSKSTVDTSTLYLGLRLGHPFMAGASPFSATLDGVRSLEDAGAAAIVLHSLFEEQITEAQSGRIHGMRSDDPEFAQRLAVFPPSTEYPFPPEEYLEHVRRVKAAVHVPVIASLNGTTNEAWLKYALLLQEAGADALEVNFYEVVTDFAVSAVAIEKLIVTAVTDLKHDLRIPVSVKLSPFFTAGFARHWGRPGVSRGGRTGSRRFWPEHMSCRWCRRFFATDPRS